MRRIVSLLLALTMCLALCACGDPEPTSNGNNLGNGDPTATTNNDDASVPKHNHEWEKATCTAPETCKTCGETNGLAKGHDWDVATDTNTMTCKVCAESIVYSTGLEFVHNGDGTCALVGIGSCTERQIVIPAIFEGSKVTSIGEEAFYKSDIPSYITIPDSVTSIGEKAFSRCQFLSGITIPISVTSIGDEAFSVCGCLKEITIPSGLTSIGARAFESCNYLQNISIPSSVGSVGDGAFSGCSNISAVRITDIVAWCKIDFEDPEANPLHEGACLYLNEEQVVSLNIPSDISRIENYAFYGCGDLENVTIPDNVVSIGEFSFSRCRSLVKINIPDSVVSIGNGAFNGCTNLEYNEYDNANYLGNELNPFVLLVNTKSHDITSCQIHDNTKFIASNAFWNRRAMESVYIPGGVVSIGGNAFASCAMLTSVHFKGTLEKWSAVSKGDSWDYSTGDYTIYCTDGEIKK